MIFRSCPLYLRATAGCDGVVHEICSICGRTADPAEDGDPPLTWCADIVETREGPHTRWVCGNNTVDASHLAQYPVNIQTIGQTDAVIVDLNPAQPASTATTTTTTTS